MQDRPASVPDARSMLGLARRDREAAERAMAELPLSQQVALVCEAPVGRRAELLDLAAAPDELVPLLPEAELCFTLKAIGLESSTWLLEHATPQQVVACIDLDAWRGPTPARATLDAWIDALAETGDEVLVGSLHALDRELLVHFLKGRIAVAMKPSASEDEGWQPPHGAQSLDGVFHFVVLREGDDAASVVRILRLLFECDYWTYFRMMQGTMWEADTENSEWAYRWRSGRLEDLGFPPWEEAMSLYRFVPPEQRARLSPQDDALKASEWHLPVWIPSLPAGRESAHLVFRALSQLEPEERRAAFYAFVAVANKVAVADHMDLADAETTPLAIEKAARWISAGLEHVAKETGCDAAAVLRRATLEHLFRVGASLEPEAARPPPSELA